VGHDQKAPERPNESRKVLSSYFPPLIGYAMLSRRKPAPEARLMSPRIGDSDVRLEVPELVRELHGAAHARAVELPDAGVLDADAAPGVADVEESRQPETQDLEVLALEVDPVLDVDEEPVGPLEPPREKPRRPDSPPRRSWSVASPLTTRSAATLNRNVWIGQPV
jgi:hypothetical protein